MLNRYQRLFVKVKRTKKILPLLQIARRLVMIWDGANLSRPIDLYTHLFALRKDIFGNFFKFAQHFCHAQQNVFGWIYSGKVLACFLFLRCGISVLIMFYIGRTNGRELLFIMNNLIWMRRNKDKVQDQLPLPSSNDESNEQN